VAGSCVHGNDHSDSKKLLGISLSAEQLLASAVRHCFMESDKT
jgi:hypothetical protein